MPSRGKSLEALRRLFSFPATGAAGIAPVAGAALLAAALLLPIGDAPWFSFWREWVASAAALLIVLGALQILQRQGLALRLRLLSAPGLALVLAAWCWLQFAAGLVPYLSDALLASLYLAGFGLCWAASAALPEPERAALADRVAAAWLAAAMLSVPIAVGQWLGWLTLDMGLRPAGGRPVAHMEQANLLCSLLVQGAIGLWRLHVRAYLGRRLSVLGLVALLAVIVLTQSRVAWLVGAVATGIVVWRPQLAPLRSTGKVMLASTVAVFAGAILLPGLDATLGLEGASLADRTSQGRRPAIWALFADAATEKPLLGWGVLQNGAAQFALAERHSSMGWYFSSAHNIALDLMVWFGIPLGLLAAGTLYLGALRRLATATTSAELATAFGATALLLHGLVELPLQYAYFLLPLGLMLGAGTSVHAASAAPGPMAVWRHRGVPIAIAAFATGLMAMLAHEYIRITDVRPGMAIDKSIGYLVLEADGPAPDVVLLDRLRAFHDFAAIPLGSAAPPGKLAAARTVLLRSPFAPVIERAAVIAAVSDDPARAAEALARVCRFETADACEESRRVWGLWRDRWAQLPPWPEPNRALP